MDNVSLWTLLADGCGWWPRAKLAVDFWPSLPSRSIDACLSSRNLLIVHLIIKAVLVLDHKDQCKGRMVTYHSLLIVRHTNNGSKRENLDIWVYVHTSFLLSIYVYNMCMCVYVCIFVNMYTCADKYMCICVYVNMCICTQL